MRLFPVDCRSLPLVFAMAVLVAVVLGPIAGAAALAAAPPAGSLWDDEGALSGSAAGALVRARLAVAVRRVGMPIAILVVGRRAATREPLDEIARRTFEDRHLAASGTPDAVLLVAAPALRRAAIETGKGDAGIVPEIDARAITTELQRRFARSSTATEVARALSDAADRISASILATVDRRRPLAEDERGEGAPTKDANQARPAITTGPVNGPPVVPGPPRRPLLPVAAGLAIMLVLALGLRQRRRGHDDGREKSGPHRR